MTVEEIERELQNLKEQLALLQTEHAKTRSGWLYWMRNTGFLLCVWGAAFLLGVWQTHPERLPVPNPIQITIAIMAIVLLAFGAWFWLFSLRPMAERLMKAASRQ
jgi:hypothetical protein